MYRKNVAGQNLAFCLVNASTGAALAGATVTAKRTIDGGAQASATGTVSDLTNGQYNLALSQADTNGNQIGILLTATGAVPVHFSLVTTAADPTDTVRFGLTALPNAAAGTTGGLGCLVLASGTASAGAATSITLAGASATDSFYNHQLVHTTGGTGANQTRIIIGYVGSTKVATVSRAWAVNPDATTTFEVIAAETMPTWNMVAGTLSAATATTATLTGAVATDSYYNGALLVITAGTGQRQARIITGYVGGTTVATLDRAWVTTPDSTSVYVVFGADSPKLDSSLQTTAASVQGNVTGSVGSVTGAVGSVTGTVGSVTGNVGGNVVGSVASVTAAVDILQTAADKVWSSASRTLTAFAQSFSDQVWTTAARTLTVFGFSVTVGTNNDKTGYTLSGPGIQAIWDALTSALTTVGSIGKLLVTNIDAAISSRLASASITLSGGAVTVGTNTDKTGYGLANNAVDAAQFTQAAADKVWTSAARTLTAFSLTLAQSVWDVLAASVVAVNSIGLQLKTNIDAAVSSRLASGSYTAPPSAASISTTVWTEPLPGAFGAGSAGAKLNAAGAASDPLANPVPGSYASGTAGNLLGNRLDAAVSTRLATAGYTAPLSGSATAAAVLDEAVGSHQTAGTVGAKLEELHGLLGKFSGVRNTVYSGSNLASYDIVLYDTSGHAATNDGVTGLLHKFSVANTFDGGGNLLTSVTMRVS